MKISETKPAGRVGGTRRARNRSAATVTANGKAASATSAGLVPTVREVASFLGIPAAELTPAVREGIQKLMQEVLRLRRENEIKDRRIARLEKLADEDPLTPILNRRAFVRELSRMMAYCERYGGGSSLLFFDVNGMKRINDTFGHAAGDAALTHVADILVGNVRTSDAVGRLGGDEFAVLLAQADETIALQKGAELAELIADTPFLWQGEPVTVTAAFGAVAFEGGKEPHEILDAADRAMYQRKRSARGTAPE